MESENLTKSPVIRKINDVELNRKLLHLSSIWIPILIGYAPKELSLVIFSTLTLISIILEYVRKNITEDRVFTKRFIKYILREEEIKGNPTGASYFLCGALISLLIFSKKSVVISLTILVISDSLASLIGIKYGKAKFWGKSLEGSTSFFASSMAIIMVFNYFDKLEFSLYKIFFTAFLVTFLEAGSKKIKINDNLSIPIISSFLMDSL